MQITELETDRLLLRQWKSQDFAAFAKLNSDPEVMEFFPNTLTSSESNAMSKKCQSLILQNGWGFWAAELKETNEFIGFIGIHKPKASLTFSPCTEIGWRLLREFWGNGYATEAGLEVLRFSFENLNLSNVVSFTNVSNYRSRLVMERLGLSNTKQNFEHPDITKGHFLSEFVLYRITKLEWQKNGL